MSRVFVGESYTDKSVEMFAIAELRKRGEIMVALSSGRLAGMVIFVHPSSPARQVAGPGEAEIHLLAVDSDARGHGIAASLIAACERRALSSGYCRIVLSTQPTMRAARRLYLKKGYRQNPARAGRGTPGPTMSMKRC